MGRATTVKNLPVLVRVGTRRGGCRQRSPQHLMVVVCVRPSCECCIDLNATVSEFASGTEKRTKGVRSGLCWWSLSAVQPRSVPVQFPSILSREDYPDCGSADISASRHARAARRRIYNLIR